MAHGSTAGNHKEYEGERTASTNDRYLDTTSAARRQETVYSENPTMKGYSEHVCACTCGTHSLEALEEAVEEEVPDDFAILKGRNVPYEEVGNHSQRG